MPGVGMTDGEAPECRWAADNSISRSLCEMTSGHRHDEHNLHTGDYNMQKTFGISMDGEQTGWDFNAPIWRAVLTSCQISYGASWT